MSEMDLVAIRERIYVRTAELAGLQADQINSETSLESVGLDSSDAVILAMEVEEMTGVEVDVGIFLRFSNLGEAVDELTRALQETATA
jgi:acyl carrier protein